jgi:transposase
MFLREDVIKRKGGEYRYFRLVKTFWDKKQKKVRQKTVVQLGKLEPEEVEFFKKALAGKAGKRFSLEELTVKKTSEYLAVAILDRIYRYWQLDKVLPAAAEVLTINRCLCPESDYQVSRWYEETILPRVLGITLNPTKIYRTLDKIYDLTETIQKHLYNKITELKLDDYKLIFYDITSSYFTHSKCELARYGLSRDHRRDKKQIVLALAVTKKGFPFYWKVFEGNTADTTTVKGFVDELKSKFSIGKACLVMDRGMVSKTNLEKIKLKEFNYIVTLNKYTIGNIKDMPWDYLEAITEENVNEKMDYFKYYSRRAYYRELKPEDGRRYILCFNPEKFLQERKDRLDKIESIKKYFDNRNKTLSEAKGQRSKEVLREEIKKYLRKRAAGKIFKIRLLTKGKTFHISYKTVDKAIREQAVLDGVYVIMSNVKKASPGTLISAYRSRMEIERSFHQLKSFVEIRPLYHHNEERIKAHVSICVLSYLLNNTVMHMVRQHEDFEELTAQSVYNYLKSCKLSELRGGSEKRLKITVPTADQEKLTAILAGGELLDEENVQQYL